MSNFSQNDLTQVTREVEVTPGVVVGAARDRVYGTAPAWSPTGATLTSGINTGSGGVKSVRAGLRAADFTLPSELVFGLNDKEWEDVLRDEFPASEGLSVGATVTNVSIASGAQTTTANGSGADTTGARTRTFRVTIGVWTDGTHAITFEDSPDGSSWSAIGGALLTNDDAPGVINITDNTRNGQVIDLVYSGTQPHLRAVKTVSGTTTGAVYGVGVIEVADQVSATFANAGTHEDGTTGPTITAAAGAFSAFANGEGLMMETTGAAAAPNKRPRMIKAVKSDGTKIDIHPAFVTGGAGEASEPLTNETALAKFNIGKFLRNQGITNIRTVNFEMNFTDQPGGSFLLVRGQKGAGFKVSFEGKGNVMLEFRYVGMDYNAATTATAGNGTVNQNAAVDNDNMVAGEDLAYFLINGSIQLAAENLTSFSLDGNGNAQGIDDVSGSRFRPGVTVGDIDVTGSMKLYHDHALMTAIANLARNGDRVPLALKIIDPDGNFYWLSLSKVLFEPGGPTGGAKGSKTDGSFNWKSQLGDGASRTFALQAFAA